MAAGRGPALRPLTERWPKPVLPIDGRPVIATLLRELAAAGFVARGRRHRLSRGAGRGARRRRERLRRRASATRDSRARRRLRRRGRARARGRPSRRCWSPRPTPSSSGRPRRFASLRAIRRGRRDRGRRDPPAGPRTGRLRSDGRVVRSSTTIRRTARPRAALGLGPGAHRASSTSSPGRPSSSRRRFSARSSETADAASKSGRRET